MNAATALMHGTVMPDGTLRLTEPVKLPPGPVEVTVQALPVPKSEEEWLEFLKQSQAELEANGYPFFTSEEEVRQYVDELRSGDERADDIPSRGEAPERDGG